MSQPTLDKQNQLTVHFETLGCRLNQIETEGAAGFFSEANFRVLMNPVQARDRTDPAVACSVLNTCAVTTKAEQKARRTIRLLLQKFPNAVLIVTGCYAQLSAEEIQKMDPRIVALPGQAKSRLAELPPLIKKSCGAAVLRAFFMRNDSACDVFRLAPETFFAHSRASLKVQDGCNNNCSYCAIHLARGSSVSIEPALAIERVRAFEESGQNEVVLTGVNIGQYAGVYEGKTVGVAGLLRLILDNTKKIAVRFSSIYPETVTEEFCEIIKNPRVRPHFHISLQSGSNSVLKRMNRCYNREAVVEAVRRLKAAKKNPFLACDIITGFPGETEVDFADTMSLIKECGFINVHAFPFSPRPGTAAFSMTPKIPERIKVLRVQALGEFSSAQKVSYINSFSGKVLEGIAENHSGHIRAVTDNFIHAEISSGENIAGPVSGDAVRVRILGADAEAVKAGNEWNARAEIV